MCIAAFGMIDAFCAIALQICPMVCDHDIIKVQVHMFLRHIQPSKVMTMENQGILAITGSSAIICNRLEVPNCQRNYPFSKFTS